MVIYYKDLGKIIEDENLSKNFVDLALLVLHRKRQDKIKKLRPLKDKVRSAAAGILLERALTDYGKAIKDISSFEVGYTEHGKPYIKEYPDFHFSISHSGNFTVLVTSDSAVGIDIQEMKSFADYEGIARYIFSVDEKNGLTNCNKDEDKQEFFYRVWSSKEAFVKMTSQGISESLQNYTADFETMMITEGRDGLKDKPHAYIKEIKDFDGYSLFICSKEPISDVKLVAI